MTAITPRPAGSAEARLDAAAAMRLDAAPSALVAAAWDPALVDAAYLPILAWALSIDEWSPDWDESTQRGAIRGAIDAHRRKGTAAGVKGMLDRIGAQYTYTERINNAPFTAAVTVLNSGSLRKSDAVSLRSLIDSHKRGTVHMTLTLRSSLDGDIPVAAGLGSVMAAQLALDADLEFELSGQVGYAAGLGSVMAAPLFLDAGL